MMNKLSIGFVIDDNLDSTAGVQQFTLTLGRELAKRGHNVAYLTSNTSESHPESHSIYSLSKTVYARMNGNKVGTPLPASVSSIRRALDRESFDVIHVTTPYSPVLAGRIIARTKAAIVGTFHIAVDTPVAGIGARLLALVQRRSLRTFHYWTAVSAAAEDFAIQYYKIHPEEITPNPIDLPAFVRSTKSTNTSSKLTISFLGRLVERKGAQHLLEAVALMSPETKDKIQVKIGGGGSLRDQLESFVQRNQLEDVVEFLGFIPEDSKADFLAASDICVFPSTGGECFGISLLEGMAVGSSVVIGGDNKGYRTVLGDGPDLLVDAKNYTAFAQRLTDLVNDPQQRASIIEWQNNAVAQYDVPIIADQMESIYRKAIKRKNQNS